MNLNEDSVRGSDCNSHRSSDACRFLSLFACSVLIVTAAILLAGIYYYYNPALNAIFPKCPFHSFTGLDCPGCGSQRAIHALLNGEIKQAIHYNLLLVISLPFLIIHFGCRLRSIPGRKELCWPLISHPLTPIVILILVICFWVLRNIPAYPFSYLSASL